MALELALLPNDLRQMPKILVRRLRPGLSRLDPSRPPGPKGQRILSRDPINASLRAPGHTRDRMRARLLGSYYPFKAPAESTFEDLARHSSKRTRTTVAAAKRLLTAVEKSLTKAVDRMVASDDSVVVTSLETRLKELHAEKAALTEKIANEAQKTEPNRQKPSNRNVISRKPL